jgi:hypothetical protein
VPRGGARGERLPGGRGPVDDLQDGHDNARDPHHISINAVHGRRSFGIETDRRGATSNGVPFQLNTVLTLSQASIRLFIRRLKQNRGDGWVITHGAGQYFGFDDTASVNKNEASVAKSRSLLHIADKFASARC